MKPSIYPVEHSGPGAIYVMPKPSGEWLGDDIAYYKSLGVGLIISLLEASEICELGLENEALVCSQNDIDFYNFPIVDRGLPSQASLLQCIDRLYAYLQSDITIAVHCRAGIGRTGLVVGCLLQKTGLTAEDAIDIVSKARGLPIPDTDQQKAFIYKFVE